jgi:hypothetical protein
MKPSCACIIAMFCLVGTAQAVDPSPEQVLELITKLGDSKFQVREQASAELARLGLPALRALRDAGVNHKDLEVRKRALALVETIEARDRPRSALLAVLARLQKTQPPLSEKQLAVAIHLLSLSRPATEREIATVEKRLKGAKDRSAEAEDVMWTLLNGQEFNGKLAEINLEAVGLKQKVTGMNLAEKLAWMNGPEAQKSLDKMTRTFDAALDKRSDSQRVDTLFLVFLARFPAANETTQALAHIKKLNNRNKALEDLVWAITNTKEFLMGTR